MESNQEKENVARVKQAIGQMWPIRLWDDSKITDVAEVAVAAMREEAEDFHYNDCGVAGGFPHPASACAEETEEVILEKLQQENIVLREALEKVPHAINCGVMWQVPSRCNCWRAALAAEKTE